MKTILIPTDFSRASQNASEYAAKLAEFFDAKLILLNAFSSPQIDYQDILSPEERKFKAEETSVNQLETLRKKLSDKHKNLNVEYCALMGAPIDAIETAAFEFNVDLIVMGITGNAGFVKEYIIGSTALEVARKLNVSTFIVPEDVKYHRVHKISFACDMEKTEDSDLAYVAKYFSKIFDAELEVLYVDKAIVKEQPEKAASKVFVDKTLQTVQHHQVTLHDNYPGYALEDYIKSHNTDVLMLSPKKYNFFESLFHSSVTRKLAFHVKLPLLIIH